MVVAKFILLVALLSPFARAQSIGSFPGQPNQPIPLYYRLQLLDQTFDVDKNGVFTNEEITAWLTQHDNDTDDCVTLGEWNEGWIAMGFSEEFANYFFELNNQFGNESTNCSGISIDAFRNNASERSLLVEDVLDHIIDAIIGMCEAHNTLYQVNLDCEALPFVCRAPPFACRRECEEYVFVTTAGRPTPLGRYDDGSIASFAHKLGAALEAEDANGDGIITAAEVQNDLQTNYDVNNDSCVDGIEFKARMVITPCGGFGFSEEFTDARFNALRVAASPSGCNGISTTVANSSDQSADRFNTENLQTLIQLCEGDRERYNRISDCRSLPWSCRLDRMRSNPTCQQYLQTIAGRNGFPFEEAQQISGAIFENGTLLFDFFNL